MSREIFDCLKRKRDIYLITIISGQNTAFMLAPRFIDAVWALKKDRWDYSRRCLNMLKSHLKWTVNCLHKPAKELTWLLALLLAASPGFYPARSKQGLGLIPLGFNVETQRTCGINAEIKKMFLLHIMVSIQSGRRRITVVKFHSYGQRYSLYTPIRYQATLFPGPLGSAPCEDALPGTTNHWDYVRFFKLLITIMRLKIMRSCA